jgi:hypothetical protein
MSEARGNVYLPCTLLATPDIRKVISGDEKDAVATILAQAFGRTGHARLSRWSPFLLSLVCLASRRGQSSMFSFGRERMIVGHAYFGRGLGSANVPLPH